jgi:aspartate/methionine/tyrosine aminotransferase
MQSVTPGQVLLDEVLASPDPMHYADTAAARYKERLKTLITPFENSKKVTVHEPEGAFYLLPTVTPEFRESLTERGGYRRARAELPANTAVTAGDCLYYHLMDAADVQGVPGRVFGDAATDAVRLSVGGTPVEEIAAVTDEIAAALASF